MAADTAGFSGRRAAVAGVVCAACVAALLSLFARRPASAPHPDGPPRLEPVVLANRTVHPAACVAPAPPAALSPRGTAAYALVCAAPVTQAVRARAARLGLRVAGYLPRRALLVEATPAAIAAALGDAHFAGAFAYRPADKVRAGVSAGDVVVAPLAEEDRTALADFVVRSGGRVRLAGPSLRGTFAATVSRETLAALANRGDVLWIDRATDLRAFNDYAVADTGVADTWDSLGLTGRGQTLATADTGIDTGVLASLHADFANRIVALENAGGITTADHSGHGTHTAGTLAGSGVLSGGRYRGVAYEANLFVQACGTNTSSRAIVFGDGISTYDDIFAAGIPSGAYIHSDSWGGDAGGAYDSFCAGLDDVVWRHPELLVVMAAGNAGSQGDMSVCPPGSAKNALTVGNVHSSRNNASPDAISASSSRGPCADGRIKPDIVAPGVSIVSCRTSMRPGLPAYASNDGYTSMSGTSMATPHVAGCAALVREWLGRDAAFADTLPSAALLKAVLTGGAAETGLPRMTQGFGRVDLAETLAPSNRCVKLRDWIPFDDGSCTAYTFTLTNTAPFEAQLAWVDYPATPSAGVALVNDLDLMVVNLDTGARWFGNGAEDGDRLNTVESVRLASAAPGLYRVMVLGACVPYASAEGGAAALYVRGAFAADDGNEETVPDRRVAVTVEGPAALAPEGLSPSVTAKDFSRVSLSAPRLGVATNACGTAVARHALTGWSVDGVAWQTDLDDGTNVVVSFVATNDVSVTWTYDDAADDYALYFVFSAHDPYVHRGYPCFVARDGATLCNDVVRGAAWIGRGETVRLDIPGAEVGDEYPIYTLYYRGSFGNARTLSLRVPLALKLGAVSLVETDGDPEHLAGPRGTLPRTLDFSMDGAKDVIGHYWNATNVVAGSSLPYWWYMRMLDGARGGGYPGLSADAADYVADDGDPDGDGFGNRAEYDEGTVPVDPMSFPFRIISFSPTDIVWLGGKTAAYTVETASSLARDAEWSVLGAEMSAAGVTNSASLAPPAGTDAAFFRLRARAK